MDPFPFLLVTEPGRSDPFSASRMVIDCLSRWEGENSECATELSGQSLKFLRLAAVLPQDRGDL